VSWDPEGHPAQPERWSHGLSVSVTPDGRVHTKAFGAPQGDLSLRVEVTHNAAGQRVMRFPYTSAP